MEELRNYRILRLPNDSGELVDLDGCLDEAFIFVPIWAFFLNFFR